MRLLLVTPEFPPQAGGGILKYYAALSEALVEVGVDVSVLVATPFFSCPDREQHGVRVASVSPDRVRWHSDHLTHLVAAPQYRQWLAAGLAAAEWIAREGHRFDLIEVSDFGLLFAPLLTLDARPPLVVAFHGSVGQIAEHEPVARYELDGALARLTEAVLLPLADGLYSYGPANAAVWSHRLGRDVEFFAPPLPMPRMTSKDAGDDGAMSAVVVGRIQSWKGPELLCRAIRAMGSRLPADLTIQWVGRDTDSAPGQRSMNEWLASTYPDVWNRKVTPLGARSAAEVECLQAAARCVLVPSRWDVFNYTLAEAMALGRVTVTSTGAGAAYLVEPGVNGFVAEPDDAEGFGTALLEACTLSAADRGRVGAAARETIARELDPRAVATQRVGFYDRVQRHPLAARPAPWISDFLAPDPGRTVAPDHLEHVAIRDLAAHLTQRLIRKVSS